MLCSEENLPPSLQVVLIQTAFCSFCDSQLILLFRNEFLFKTGLIVHCSLIKDVDLWIVKVY